MKKLALSILFFLLFGTLKSQELIGLSVKTNILNLIAAGPSFSIEKTFSNRYGLELSYASGQLNWGRDYKYDGFLLRGKKYIPRIEPSKLTPFVGLYIGNLNKTIISKATVDNTGYFSTGKNRNFNANSMRYGGNLGFLFIPKKRFLIETTTGLGYGK